MKQKSLIFAMLLIPSVFAGSASATIIVQDYWQLGEADSPAAVIGGAGDATTTATTGGLNLSKVSNPTYANPAPGSTIAMHFNGSSAYTDATAASLPIDDFGMEIWVRPTVANETAMLFYNGNDGANGMGILLVNGIPYLLFGNQDIIGASTALPLNTWTHLAITRDTGHPVNSRNYHLWVNGVDVADAANNPPNTPNGKVLIGENFSGAEFFTGDLDDARMFTFTSGQFQSSDLLFQAVATTPEPGTLGLLGAGGSLALLWQRRRRRAA